MQNSKILIFYFDFDKRKKKIRREKYCQIKCMLFFAFCFNERALETPLHVCIERKCKENRQEKKKLNTYMNRIGS